MSRIVPRGVHGDMTAGVVRQSGSEPGGLQMTVSEGV